LRGEGGLHINSSVINLIQFLRREGNVKKGGSLNKRESVIRVESEEKEGA
jgi:hypothetical protein